MVATSLALCDLECRNSLQFEIVVIAILRVGHLRFEGESEHPTLDKDQQQRCVLTSLPRWTTYGDVPWMQVLLQ